MSDHLSTIVMSADLDAVEVANLTEQFGEYQRIATEWETKAKAIVVTDPVQTVDMKMARAGRLFLRDKRVAIEKTRKALKESSLRKGKAIDAIAKYLTGLIEPIEDHLDKQEHFVEIREKAEAERIRKEEEARLEAERIEREKKEAEERAAKERADREERERIAAENAKLRAENDEKERQIREERERNEAERRRVEQEKREAEQKAQVERETAAKEKAELEAKLRKAEEPAPDAHEQFNVICPKCGHQFNP